MKKKLLTLSIVLALVMVLASPMAVLAQTGGGTSTVTGTVPLVLTYTISVPLTVSIGNLNSGANNPSPAQTMSVATNDSIRVSAGVQVLGTNSGFLYDGSAVSLDSALTLSGTNCQPVTLTGANQDLVLAATGVLDGGSPNQAWVTPINDLVIAQPPFTPVAAGPYSCTITFTATFQ